MDPNETLKELRDLAQTVTMQGGGTDEQAVRMAELVQALDSWMTTGGFSPAAWNTGARATA
ncbi:hypothetical protein SEA_GODPHATHER_87 [Mycobacterium phage GodPhather]|uniref:Uncharacterized protein n=2 Tax=Northamptonvirus TaxID=3044777 RepID=A0A1J0MDR5_9CAUD|nr:HNH endonuclease [Mycobacterium phage Jeon]YP_010665456.1 HNH endonuclease [Mycobacterium phage Taptic]AVO21394.1 hypothetical protein PBI_MEGABEAR_85 [Mycobacterium phage Megabear]QBP31204.1 hypothetical protein SEA_ARGIE_88 [Mycobacterium phage Argie]QBP32658.1 hypothetical protein SEA_GODPHATHER_87 [Mycobacterium phage GodPhather]QBP32747.1 hypothetical protein SEA_CEPENS_87 [Mycobacterium phage Cepens]WRQ08258.1 hypothetical protein JDBV14_00720 [Mycobacterium phage harman]